MINFRETCEKLTCSICYGNGKFEGAMHWMPEPNFIIRHRLYRQFGLGWKDFADATFRSFP